jgi:hypothetical protein
MSSLSYDVAKLLKDPDNRFCTDCQAPLTNPQTVFANVRYGIWICSNCADMHGTELLQKSFLRKATDSWNHDEIKIMKKTPNNAAFNKVFERYIPTGWEKIHANATTQERKNWIKAKYYSHYFTVPQTTAASLSKIELNRKKRIVTENVLPPRMVDYFLVLGAAKAKSAATPEPETTLTAETLENIEFKIDIIDSYPAKNSYEDTPIPELVGPIVFPSGLKLSKTEKPPFDFSFVLTDINRVKLYGTTLIIYEIIDLELLSFLLSGTAVGTKRYSVQELKKMTKNLVYYMPKALTIISHYPFFQLFRKFLEQIFHVSLSSSPLPLERYLVNFMKELPLPPQGKIEILFSLPQIQMNLTRPAKNQLPMIDFSYRPLFTCLSVDHILIVFNAMCLEMSICFLSRNISLLTPVQEGLLSFLFPFVWQGCYVPILPIQMIEMLDAPVPLLAGMNYTEVEAIQNEFQCSNENIVFVNIDSDQLTFGWGNDPIKTAEEPYQNGFLLPLPSKSKQKLKSKLEEFAGGVYQKNLPLLFKAGIPFPQNEHLTPIKSYISEQGVITSTSKQQRQGSMLFAAANNFKLGIRSNKSPNNTGSDSRNNSKSSASVDHPSFNTAKLIHTVESDAVPYKHPCASTLVISSNSASSTSSILDVENNFNPSEPFFNGKEIRDAFLRFFVASFSDYQEFFLDAKTNLKKNLFKVPTNTPENNIAGKKGQSPPHVKDNETVISTASVFDDVEFDMKAFKTHVQDDFLANM